MNKKRLGQSRDGPILGWLDYSRELHSVLDTKFLEEARQTIVKRSHIEQSNEEKK